MSIYIKIWQAPNANVWVAAFYDGRRSRARYLCVAHQDHWWIERATVLQFETLRRVAFRELPEEIARRVFAAAEQL